MKRWNHFSINPYQENADCNQWMMFIFRNFPTAIEILIAISKNFKCVVCGNLSLNYTAKSSLNNHLNHVHKRQTALYFLDNVATKTPDELGDLLE
jgi:hypothetical protein